MENEGQLNNSIEHDVGGNMGNDQLVYLPLDMEYDMDALMGDEDHLNTDPQAVGGEKHNINKASSSRQRAKRFTVDQLQQLESSFQECSHPDDEMRKELASKVGLETRQVRFWFQNRRSQVKVKSYGAENNKFRQQNAALLAMNTQLQTQLEELTCKRCRDPAAEKWQLLEENAKLKEMHWRANADLGKLMQEACLPPSVTLEDLASVTSMNPLPSNGGSSSNNNQATLLSYAEYAVNEFEMLARNGPPLWEPSICGDDMMLNSQEYTCQRFPRLLGIRPQGFVVEANRDTALVKGTALDVVAILTDVPRWLNTFPGIVAAVRDYHVISNGMFPSGNGLIHEVLQINVDLSVESPRPPLRSMKFLRISKQTADGEFAVVDVSIGGGHGVHEQDDSQNNKYTSYCGLLPSGCLVQDLGDGYSQVTWIVHAEYDETIVPPMFRQFFQSGQAFGPSRWLASLQRHCEYMAVMHSSHVPSDVHSGAVAISARGRWNLLELAQRMMAIFYRTTSGLPTVEPGNIVTKWGACSGTTAGTLQPAVRMVLGNYLGAMDGKPSPPLHVLSATTTVWLPGTPPDRVFSYVCNGQRRAEWDTLVYAGAVQELSSIATCPHLPENVVSVLCSNVTNTANRTTLLLQQASIDVSCALVVYSRVEKNVMHSVMGGDDSTSSFVLLPSGFAILKDGHAAANSSSTLAGHDKTTAGCLLTAAFKELVPFDNLGHPDVEVTYDNAGKRICQAIKKIMAAVGAEVVIPT